MNRRELLRNTARTALLATAAIGTKEAEAQTPAPGTDALTIEDLAVADKVEGRSYSEPQRKLMLSVMTRTRAQIKAVRSSELPPTMEPAFHFDPRLAGVRMPTGKSGAQLSKGETLAYSGFPESLAFASLVDLSRLIRDQKITSTELTKMYLDRLKKFSPMLLNVVTLTEELALTQAARADKEIAAGKYRGPLHGIPWGAKDLLATKGIRTTYGAKPYENQVFDYDAEVVKRLEAAGAVLVAKLSMGELAQGDVWYGGMTRNPWKPTTGSSGSSAGPGSATAAGLVGFSIGTETLGSIVSPSVVNGVTGLRPTYGRVPRTGAMALCWTMDKIGPMCRSVEDCALVLSAIFGPDGQDASVTDTPFQWRPASPLKRLRVGIDKEAFAAVEKDEKRAAIYKEVLKVLDGLGITLKPISLPKSTPAYASLASIFIDAESAAAFQKLNSSGELDLLARQTAGAWPTTFRVGSTIPASDYILAMRLRRQLQLEMAESLGDLDCFVTVPFLSQNLVYTNLTGHPTLVTRCGMSDGLPVMVEFVGQIYHEESILRLGLAYEKATAWHTQWPDLKLEKV
ncbi:MAG: amidase [Chthonomonadales bacterium]